MKSIIISTIAIFLFLITSCSDVVTEDQPIQGDFVKADSLDVGRTLAFSHMKGAWPSGIMEIEIEGDDSVYSADIGRYSTGIFTISNTTLTALAKDSDQPSKKLVKSRVIGQTLNEFTGVLHDVELDAYTLMDDSTSSLKTNIIHTAIALHMWDLPKTVGQFDSSLSQVKKDMNIPSWLNVNSSWDDPNTNAKSKGFHLAITGLIKEESYEKLHIMTYESFINNLMPTALDYDSVDIISVIPDLKIGELSTRKDRASKIVYSLSFPCRSAKRVMNESFRDLIYSPISDSVEFYCEQYHIDLYNSRYKEFN